jgi:hypothetical protein
MKGLRTEVINWSDDTIRRRIRDDGFPAMKDEKGRYTFCTDDVLDWFKRRTVKP